MNPMQTSLSIRNNPAPCVSVSNAKPGEPGEPGESAKVVEFSFELQSQ